MYAAVAVSSFNTEAGLRGDVEFFSKTISPVFSSITITEGLANSLLEVSRSKIEATEFGSSALAS